MKIVLSAPAMQTDFCWNTRDEEKTGAKRLFHSIRGLMALVRNQSSDIAAMMVISTTRINKSTALIDFSYQRA